MPNRFAELTERLQRLVEQVMTEPDAAKSDELCAEIWRVIGERDEIRHMADRKT